MSTIGTETVNLATATAAAERATAQTSAPSRNGADQSVFLRLLVEQLKHQDPLAPQDGAQFVAQLAQFNALDQLTSINQRIGLLLENNQR